MTSHAEINLARAASRKYSGDELARAIMYSSNESCMMCVVATYWVGIRALVFSASYANVIPIAGESLSLSLSLVFSFCACIYACVRVCVRVWYVVCVTTTTATHFSWVMEVVPLNNASVTANVKKPFSIRGKWVA